MEESIFLVLEGTLAGIGMFAFGAMGLGFKQVNRIGMGNESL
jgi:hypothetical protein